MKRSLLTHFLRSIVLAATLAALLGAGTGCRAIRKASDDTVAYVRGELDTTLSHRFQDTVKATKGALEELKFTKVSTNEDALLAAAIGDVFDLRPAAIIERFGLRRPIFERTASGGHFGRIEFPWEQNLPIGALLAAVA